MMKRLCTLAAIAAASLAICGCAELGPKQISATPAGGGIPITNPTIVTDLQDAAYNLDNAAAVGAIAADDPAPACMHDVLVKAGIEVPAGAAPAKSFEPKYGGPASSAAVAYIVAQQLKQMKATGVKVDVNCEALVGRLVIDGATAANQAALGVVGARLPSLLK